MRSRPEKKPWLGDAFRLRGSQGYDPQEDWASQARGAWEAVKRHFRELGTDIRRALHRGRCGHMSGRRLRQWHAALAGDQLVRGFRSPRTIFVDPSPTRPSPCRAPAHVQPAAVELAGYDKSLISLGGGGSASLKAIPLALEVRALLDLDKPQATPSEVVTAITEGTRRLLCLAASALYPRCGGNRRSGWRSRHDPIRVTGADVRARVIAKAPISARPSAVASKRRRKASSSTDAIDNRPGSTPPTSRSNLKIALAPPERGWSPQPGDRSACLSR